MVSKDPYPFAEYSSLYGPLTKLPVFFDSKLLRVEIVGELMCGSYLRITPR